MKATRAIFTLLALGLVALVVMAAVGTGLALLAIATWPWRRRAQRRATSRALARHALTVTTAQHGTWANVDRLVATRISTKRSAS